jgi:hypothetical protein
MQGAQKIKLSKNRSSNEAMSQQTKQSFFKGRSPNGQKIHEEMFNIRDSKGKGNKNHMKIAPHSC